ncbi:MAG: alpha-amylase, partial [bacterium]|nr:alpha-amylase [Candidatus Kapabacteria bacterium]
MVSLILAFHNHQPVGNFDWVIEDAYATSYLPLMTMLSEYPDIRFGQHYTGILLDWFAKNHPDFLELIGRGVRDGRVELVSGGYYEPVLAMLPERDRQAQITRLNRRIERDFGAHPRGMWLAERVWEPSLPATLNDAGLAYTFLDDTHFKHAGLVESELTGYFLTEDQGQPLAVLPIDKRLRYTMPFEPPETTIEYLHSLHHKGHDRLVVFADDGEKFGTWPGTFESVYAGGWLRRFCELLKANADWIRTLRPNDALTQLRPAGRL